MSFFGKLLGRKSKSANDQAVLVHLDGQGLPDEVYAECDLETLEEQLISAIEAHTAGEFDGNEFGPGVTTLYMYRPDAERLFSVIEPTLRAYPLCFGARVVVRRGGPGSAQRELLLQP